MKTLGFYGTGAVALRAINRFIPPHLDGDDARFIFLVDDAWNSSLDRLLDFGIEHGEVLCVVPEGDEFTQDAESDGIPVHETDDPYNAFLEFLEDEEADLVLLWNDEDEETEEALTSMARDAIDEGLRVFDLVHGMRALEPADDDDTEDESSKEENVGAYDTFLDNIDAADDPDEILELFQAKKNRDHLVTLGESLQLDFKPSTWQKNLAPKVHEVVIDGYEDQHESVRDIIQAAQGASEDDEPEEESQEEVDGRDGIPTEPEDDADEPEDEPTEDDDGGYVSVETVQSILDDSDIHAARPLDILGELAGIYKESGKEGAKEYLEFLREESLIDF